MIQSQTSQRTIKFGDQSNDLTITARGDTVTLGIDGATLGTYTVQRTSLGWSGINASNANAYTEIEVGFKNPRLAP